MTAISESTKTKLGLQSLRKAEHYLENNNYGRAFAHYLVCLELVPQCKTEHELKFCDVLNIWCSVLENGKQDEDVRKCYVEALRYFPASEIILNNYGSYLMRIRKNYEARKFLQLANDLKPDSLPPEKNLQAVKLNLIERWHFRMLNDYNRNKAFKDAIESIDCVPGSCLLDIGSGSGILSLFASKNKNIDNIFAVERSKTLSELSTNIFRLNRINNVTVLNMHSKHLTGDIIRNAKCNLVVTEIFDTALFGEHALCTLIHLWETILPENAKIMPCKAELFITGINCGKLYRNHKYIQKNRVLKFDNLCITQESNHPYDAFHLKDFKTITNTVLSCTVDFNNVADLKNIYTNFDAFKTNKLECLMDGQMDALAVWFDLYLTDDIKISTSPFDGKVKCWEQAIIFLDHPVQLYKSELVPFKLSCVKDKLEAKLLKHNQSIAHKCFRLSPEVITFLNDEYLVNTILSLCDTIENKQIIVLDLFPLPLFGLMLAKKGAKVFSTASTDREIEFIEHFCDIHNIDVSNIKLIDAQHLEEYLQYTNLFDIVFASPINCDGIVFQKNYTLFEFYQGCLKPNGMVLPKKVKIKYCIIESDYLTYCNGVSDENVMGFKIAEYINDFSSNEHWSLPKDFPHSILSDEIEGPDILESYDKCVYQNISVPLLKKGKPNAALYWFDYEFLNGITFSTKACDFFDIACYLLNDCLPNEDVLNVNIKQQGAFIKIYCDEQK